MNARDYQPQDHTSVLIDQAQQQVDQTETAASPEPVGSSTEGAKPCAPIHYSRGRAFNDNNPKQRVAKDFDDFERDVLGDNKSREKGKAYICGPLAFGPHSDQKKYPGKMGHWRLKGAVQERAFLPLDVEHIGPEQDAALLREVAKSRGFSYTTASHTPERPRRRVLLAQTRPTTREEGIKLAQVVRAKLTAAGVVSIDEGAQALDPAVDKGEQPLYCPMTGAKAQSFHGAALDVDVLLAAWTPEMDTSAKKHARVDAAATPHSTDVVLEALRAKGLVKSERPDSDVLDIICPLTLTGGHSQAGGETSTTYRRPGKGYASGLISCLRDCPANNEQPAYWAALGLDCAQVEALNDKARTGSREVVGAHAGGMFVLDDRGLYFRPPVEAGGAQPADSWVCGPLRVVGDARDACSSEWGRVVEYRTLDGVHKSWVIPREMLHRSPEVVTAEFARFGLELPGCDKHPRLIAYLRTAKTPKLIRNVSQPGWYGCEAFVEPGRVFGDLSEGVVFQGSMSSLREVASDLTAWRASVGRLAVGNSRLLLAVSTALAGTLLDVVGEASGGFHFVGGAGSSSSSGKTTTLRVAASVWGSERYMLTWRTTSNALEVTAAQHNDSVLILDEIGQVDARNAGDCMYMICNGAGKARLNKEVAPRPKLTWRLLFLSTGEHTLRSLMAEASRGTKTGQEVRMLEIDADAGAGMGCFEHIHEYASPASFAEGLKELADRYYGAAGEAWLERVVKERAGGHLRELVRVQMEAFLRALGLDGADGVVRRAARRFALVAAAGELASSWGITGWPEGATSQACSKCFGTWLAGFGGDGRRDARAVVAQVVRYLEEYGHSRFLRLQREGDTHAVTVEGELLAAGEEKRSMPIRAGYAEETDEGVRYLVFPEHFREVVISGHPLKAACAALVEAGVMARGSKGYFTKKVRLPGSKNQQRVYVLHPEGSDA